MLADQFMLRDILETLAAFGLYPLLLFVPGGLVAWRLDILSFRQQRVPIQIVIGLTTSIAVVPIALYLLGRIEARIGFGLVWIVLGTCGVCGLYLLVTRPHIASRLRRELRPVRRVIALIGAGWLLVIAATIDVQWQEQVSFSLIALYDFPTRIAFIREIANHGIPLLDPLFFPRRSRAISVCLLLVQLGKPRRFAAWYLFDGARRAVCRDCLDTYNNPRVAGVVLEICHAEFPLRQPNAHDGWQWAFFCFGFGPFDGGRLCICKASYPVLF